MVGVSKNKWAITDGGRRKGKVKSKEGSRAQQCLPTPIPPLPETPNVSYWWQTVFYRTSLLFPESPLILKSSTTPGKVQLKPGSSSLWFLSESLLIFFFYLKNDEFFRSTWSQLLDVHIWLLVRDMNVPCLVLKYVGNFARATIWRHTPSFPYFRTFGSLLFFHLYFRPSIVIKRREEISWET